MLSAIPEQSVAFLEKASEASGAEFQYGMVFHKAVDFPLV
jgi:hypothetical protein